MCFQLKDETSRQLNCAGRKMYKMGTPFLGMFFNKKTHKKYALLVTDLLSAKKT
jgi:hypothetical protein